MSKLIPIDLNGDRNFKGNLYDKKEVDAQLEQLQARVAEDELKIKFLRNLVSDYNGISRKAEQFEAALKRLGGKEHFTSTKKHYDLEEWLESELKAMREFARKTLAEHGEKE